MPMRLFDQHLVRRILPLDGTWSLHFPRQGTTIAPADWASGEALGMEVPGVWETTLHRVNYRGQAVARRMVEVAEAGPARLRFAGVSHTARVLVDGREVGGHHDAFTAFAIDLPWLTAGRHEVLVHISNEHGELSGLHIPNDFYDYGGISRPVELQLLAQPLHLVAVRATPVRSDAGWTARCAVELGNCGAAEARATLVLALAGGEHRAEVSVPAGGAELVVELACPEATGWSPAAPRLHLLDARLERDGVAFDDWRDRIGFRTVACAGERILLDGQPVFLLGFNRHEDHPEYGCALPVAAMRKDLELLRDLGANAVRTSHYPNDERFLDLCDELGLLVWEENHARGQVIEQMRHPRFREQALAVTGEMVRQHHNHPSIVVWGVLNECASEHPEGRGMYAEQLALIRRLDPSRPTTYASHRQADDICQDLPDVCGWNLYPLWYRDQDPREGLARLIARYEPLGMAGKPLIISETGAGAIPGLRDPIRRAKWSEERQGDILVALIEAYAWHPRVTGLFLWQFCDVRVDDDYAMRRPGVINDKGIVDAHRQPKLAYPLVRELFRRRLAEDAQVVRS